MADNSMLIIGVVLIVLATAGLTYYMTKGSEAPSQALNQTQNQTQPTVPTITMQGEATKTVSPDLLTIGLTLETNGTTAADAETAGAQEMVKLHAALIAAGLNDSEIQSSSYYTNPIYNSTCSSCQPVPIYNGVDAGASDSNGAPVPDSAPSVSSGSAISYPPSYPCDQNCAIIGYSTVQSITINSDQVNDGGKLVEAALESSNMTSVDYVYFSLKDSTRISLESQLDADAAANARDKADGVAKGLNASLGKIESVSTDYYPYYPPVYAYQRDTSAVEGSASPAAPPTDISPSDTTVSTTITVVFDLAQ